MRPMNRRPRAAVLALAVTAVGVGLAAPAFAASPITPANRPAPLPAQVNGKVPESELVKVTPTCRAARAAASSLRLLFALARAQGVGLGADECYRPLALQIDARANATANGNAACAASVGVSSTGQPVGTSMHGWGKAADMDEPDGELTFQSPGYAMLKRYAASVGWNHPGWAEPGGSSCPEPWHWEWVGDGGDLGLAPIKADVVGLVPGPSDQGYGVVNGLGAVTVKGSLVDHGSMAAVPINWLVVGASSTPSTSSSSVSRRAHRGTATGSSPPTAASSASATRTTSVRPDPCGSTGP
jgi:hypothetical protein